ncbi:MAG: hypothetical protein Q9222_000495 [Ikaeria aurantiellina]
MASNVVVIDASARRTTIKTTPGKILNDVLQEACSKLGVNASSYGLKHNNRKLDLSNPIRLSGLPPGAKLELVLLSRSPSVVSVALQLPQSEAQTVPSGRLVEKYPSSTTLWLVLRNFESMAPGRNYTARARSRTETGDGGSGRLFHEAPVLSIMGRELTSFTDLQKTLAQLGFNDGSVLLRLSFRTSETPLEEAMEQIEGYFKAVGSPEKAGAHASSMTAGKTIPDTTEPMLPGDANNPSPSPDPLPPATDGEIQASDPQQGLQKQTSPPSQEASPPTVTGPNQRPMTVYRPPTSTTPRAAQQPFNEKDYEPSVAHARLHQARLQSSGRNKTLLSDRELADKENAKAQKVADIKEIEIKVKFPDESSVNASFTNLDTAQSLYEFARGVLNDESEPFSLRYISAKGPRTVSKDSTERLIADLGMSGRTLITALWDEGASPGVRSKPVLKKEHREQAKDIQIPVFAPASEPDEPQEESSTGKQKVPSKSGGKGGMPKWFKGLGKK